MTLDLYERLSAEATQHGIHMAGVTTRSGEAGDAQSRQPGASGMHELRTCIPEDDRNETNVFLNSLAVKEDPKHSSTDDALVTFPAPVQAHLVNQRVDKDPLARGSISMRKICHGTVRKSWLDNPETPAPRNRDESSYLLEIMYQQSRGGLQLPKPHQEVSQCQNGKVLPRESLLTLLLIMNNYHLSSLHDDLLFIAQLLTGFFALLHLGELTVPNEPRLHDLSKMVEQSSVMNPSLSFSRAIRATDSSKAIPLSS